MVESGGKPRSITSVLSPATVSRVSMLVAIALSGRLRNARMPIARRTRRSINLYSIACFSSCLNSPLGYFAIFFVCVHIRFPSLFFSLYHGSMRFRRFFGITLLGGSLLLAGCGGGGGKGFSPRRPPRRNGED